MLRPTIIELSSAKMAFSAGHFTIFSATEREPMHGHNYRVSALLEVGVGIDDIAFNYLPIKQAIIEICTELDYYFLLPTQSPYLKLREEGEYIQAEFNGDKLMFLKKDIKLLSLANVTLEGLSNWFLQQLMQSFFNQLTNLFALTIKVYNGLHQAASAKHEFKGVGVK